MTTIESIYNSEFSVDVEPIAEETTLKFTTAYSYGRMTVPTPALLAALDAVPMHEAGGLIDKEAARADEAEGKLKAAEAKLAESDRLRHELAGHLLESDAKLARVRKVREDYHIREAKSPDDQTYCSTVVSQLDIALADPEPVFVLPTTAGAGIKAQYPMTGGEYELRLFSDGNWRDELADEISGWQIGSSYYSQAVGIDEARDIAEYLIKQGYRKPATVTTPEELDALPEGSLLLASGTYYGDGTFTDCHVRILPAFIHGEDRTVIEVLIYGGSDLAKTIEFPATVLHVGGDR